MAREIKFRGKSIRSKKWFFGGIGDGGNDIIKNSLAIPVDPETVGEFTGFKDIDDNEIFEGDILQNVDYPEDRYEVRMCAGCWSLFRNVSNDLATGLLAAEFKIIGNIHDNKELLEGGKADD